MRAKNLPPRLEVLEDRLTPALTYVLDAAGDLSVTGTTANASMTITEAPGNAVTILDGAASKTFAVTGNLSVAVQSLNALYLVTYNVGGNVLGSVSLAARSLGAVDLFVNGTAASTIGGNLSLKTGVGDDLVGVNAFGGGSALTVAGSMSIDTGAGNDTLAIGGNGNVAVNGNLMVSNVNTLFFGGNTETVGGLTTVSTDFNHTGVANLISTSATTTMAGDLLITGSSNSANNVVLNGTVVGRLFANLGGGASSLAMANGASVVGSAYVLGGNGGDNVTLLGTIDGNLMVNLGSGGNTAFLGGTVAGTSISYYGGNGGDNVTFFANAPAARLTALFGNGNDSFTFGAGTALASAYINGGNGTNTFSSAVAINFPLTLVNFS